MQSAVRCRQRQEWEVLPKVDQPMIRLKDADKWKINGINLPDHRNVFQVFYLRRKARHKMSHRFNDLKTRTMVLQVPTPAGFKCCQRVVECRLICQMIVSVALIHSCMMMSPRWSMPKLSLIYCQAEAETSSFCTESQEKCKNWAWCWEWAHV